MAQQVAIVGLGLIGGSVGLALKKWSSKNSNALNLVGYDEDVSRQNKARKIGCVDQTEWSLAKAVERADVVIVATPVQSMQTVFEDISRHLKPGCVVTDTGSTKVDVMRWASALPDSVSFVGGHPMAGKSESLDAATADLFQGATWAICPSVTADEDAIRNILGVVGATGAESYFLDPVEHDSYVAATSHLPFIAAISLIESVTADASWRDMRGLVSSGLRDTTRLALGSPQMHRDIAITNRESLSRWIGRYIEELDRVKRMLDADPESAKASLLTLFDHAQDERAKLEVDVNRSEEGMTDSQREVSSAGFGDQMSRMFLGGMRRRERGGRNGQQEKDS